jgi:pimeloyl-ACP methyl ester carboxylesterase
VVSTLLCALLAAAPVDAGVVDAGVSETWKTAPMPGAMPAATEHGLAEVNGVKLYWASYGQGEPVFLLHGGAGNADHWANQVPALAAKFKVYVVDSRGHGRSTRPPGALSYAQMADDVIALMDQLKLEKAAMVGWSDGGAVALDLAIRSGARVSKLVAYATNYNLAGMKSGGGAAFNAYFARCKTDYAKLSPTPKDYKGLQEALRPMWRTQPNYTDAQVAAIAVPTMVLDGDHDEIIRQDHVRKLAKLVPGAKLVLIPDASHFALFQQPAAFNAAVLEFLDNGK